MWLSTAFERTGVLAAATKGTAFGGASAVFLPVRVACVAAVSLHHF